MCLSFDYAEAVQAARDFAAAEASRTGEAALKAAHDNVDCSKIQITVLMHTNGSRSVLCYMPLSSPTAVMAMYPCPHASLGENAKFLIPCDTIPCNAANLEALYEPGKFVPIPDVEWVPIYRGLGGDDCPAEAAESVVELPPTKYIKNLDGSCTFVLSAAEFVKSDEEIDKAIESKEYPDKPTYLLTLGKACFKSLTESMDANGVKKSTIFAMSEGDETQVDPLAMMNFLNELYPNLRPNNDMLVCIPGTDKDGNLKMEAAFSFCFHYPDARYCLPMPGLVHNIDHGAVSSEQAVEGDYYITSNDTRRMNIHNDETGVTTNVSLCGASAFLPYDQIPPGYSTGVMDQVQWRHVQRDEAFYGIPRKDYGAWIIGCASLQTKVEVAYWDSITAVCGKMGLPDFDKKNFYSTTLVGCHLPKNATAVTLPPSYAREHEGGTVLSRVKAALEVVASAAGARPNKRRAVSGVDGTEVGATPVPTDLSSLHLLTAVVAVAAVAMGISASRR